MALRIRLATLEDAEPIAHAHLDAWDWAYRGMIDDAYIDGLLAHREDRVARWQSILLEDPSERRTWVAERDGVVVGFCGTGPGADDDAAPGTGEVFALYLRPEVVGLGVGRALFGHAVRDLHDRGFGPLTLWVLRENERGRRFYDAAGWRPDGGEQVVDRPGASLHEVRYRAGGPAGTPLTPDPRGA